MAWMYALSDENDNESVITSKGDSGTMSEVIPIKKVGGKEYLDHSNIFYGSPIVDHCIRVGSFVARSYSGQDWWMTTPVTEIIINEIINERRNVKFRTRSGSVYLWKE